eukprot:jgi/Mesvir1/20300/Mv19900-RA.4
MVVLESTEAVARAESGQASMGENAEALIARGNQHFVEDDFERALQCYTHAIELEPQNAAAFVHRAATYLKLERYQDAFNDADKSTQIDTTVAKAHLRKGMAAFHLGQFKSAKGCFATGYELDPQVSAYKMWMRKCDAELEEMGGDGEGQDQATPMVADEGVVPAKTTSPAADASAANQPQQAPAAAAPSASAPAPAPAAPPPKYRLDWYQNAKEVILAVLAKGLASDDVQVFYNSDQLGVDISRGGAHDCSIRLSLCGQIVPSECSHSVSKNKIEIKLRKAEPSQWGGLEAGKAITKVAAAPLAGEFRPADATASNVPPVVVRIPWSPCSSVSDHAHGCWCFLAVSTVSVRPMVTVRHCMPPYGTVCHRTVLYATVRHCIPLQRPASLCSMGRKSLSKILYFRAINLLLMLHLALVTHSSLSACLPGAMRLCPCTPRQMMSVLYRTSTPSHQCGGLVLGNPRCPASTRPLLPWAHVLCYAAWCWVR